jgi:hypothetical protein
MEGSSSSQQQKEVFVYSPKISEELIPRIYRISKRARLPMTEWVNRAIRQALSPNPTTPERIVMKETTAPTAQETLIVVNTDNGFRVCSPLTPAKQHTVTGVPNEPLCSCEEFQAHMDDPEFVCKHIEAVQDHLRKQNHHDGGNGEAGVAPTNRLPQTPPPTEAKKRGRTNGQPAPDRQAQMLLKRSVSPDGRIDSLSVEFTLPVGSATVAYIKEAAERVLSPEERSKVAFYLPNAFLARLRDWAAANPAGGKAEKAKPRKQKIQLFGRITDEERKERERDMLGGLLSAMKRKPPNELGGG